MKTKYCLGFLFSFAGPLPQVVLIQKTRPAWMAGKLNGVGGHVEVGEFPHDAMVREFREETGVEIEYWTAFAQVVYPDCEIFCFAAQENDKTFEVHSITDEKVGVYQVDQIVGALRNLTWMIPMAITRLVYWPSSELLRIEPI